MKIIWHWLLLSAAVWATAYILPGISLSMWWVAIIVGACLMFINTLIKPIISVLTLPINIITLGLFSLILNGLIFWLLSQAIPGFVIGDFKSAIIGSILCSLAYWAGKKIFG